MKNLFLCVVSLLLALAMLAGCAASEPTGQENLPAGDSQPAPVEKIGEFVDISWTRETANDAQTIRFGADGSFTYSCACGDPVNDADLCEGYTYDEATKTITLDCIETTEEMVTVIQVLKCNDTELQLDFNGDVRTFTK